MGLAILYWKHDLYALKNWIWQFLNVTGGWYCRRSTGINTATY